MKKHIVMFWFMNDWGKCGRAYEKIAEQLSRHYAVERVLCVLPPTKNPQKRFTWPLIFSKFSKKLIVLSQASRFIPTQNAPYRLRKWLNIVVPDLLFRLLLKLLGYHQQNTVLWLFPPHRYIDKLSNLVPHFRIIVQVVDNNFYLEALKFEYRQFAKTQYEELARTADSVIVSSDMNYEIFKEKNQNTYKFENAVDPIFLAPKSVSSRLSRQARPRLGYVGWVTERTDLDLLTYLAKQRPDYDVILAGPNANEVDMGSLIAVQNISWLGPIPYEQVPAFLGSLDVCLIPHRDSLYSRSMSPLKLLQYLASGHPIVSTPVAGASSWKEYVLVSHNYMDFVSKVDLAIHCDSEEKSKSRIQAAAKETWDKRVADMVESVLL